MEIEMTDEMKADCIIDMKQELNRVAQVFELGAVDDGWVVDKDFGGCPECGADVRQHVETYQYECTKCGWYTGGSNE